MASLLHALAAYSNFNGRWAFGRIGCQLYGMGVGMFGLISILVWYNTALTLLKNELITTQTIDDRS
jgi:hypothetical protein